MSISRRSFSETALAAALLALCAGDAEAQEPTPTTHPDYAGHEMPASWYGKEKIAFLAYPGFTALDLVGPHYMLANLMGATTHIVAKTKDPVVSDMKLTVVPSTTFEDCPADLDIICVPGGADGTLAAMEDKETIAFLKDRGSRAKYVTSVCTGSLVLGAAGLLKGYKATSHWAARDILRDFGAEPMDQRVVIDRNRITGAGVTAGLDFGLTLVGKLREPRYAQTLQLLAEYAPSPPFNSGTPATSDHSDVEMIEAMMVDFSAKAKAIGKRAVVP